MIRFKEGAEPWREAFDRGDSDVMEQCYRENYQVVETAIGGLLGVADRETVVHEVFFRLLTDRQMRESYRGPTLGPWLAAIARNRAVDLHRRSRRETLVAERPEQGGPHGDARSVEEATLRILLERFCRQHLPADWVPLFEARFLREMTQREAARHLGMRRTTLAYRELVMRRRLRQFMLSEEGEAP